MFRTLHIQTRFARVRGRPKAHVDVGLGQWVCVRSRVAACTPRCAADVCQNQAGATKSRMGDPIIDRLIGFFPAAYVADLADCSREGRDFQITEVRSRTCFVLLKSNIGNLPVGHLCLLNREDGTNGLFCNVQRFVSMVCLSHDSSGQQLQHNGSCCMCTNATSSQITHSVLNSNHEEPSFVTVY